MDGGADSVAEVHNGDRGPLLLLLLLRTLALLVLWWTGWNAIFRQKLFKVHVLQLKIVAIVRQGLIPKYWAQEGRVRHIPLFLQLLLLVINCNGN